MEFNEFVETVRDLVVEYLLQYDIDKVCVEEVTKNNGISLTGLIIVEKGKNVHPNIYLNNYYSMYTNGTPVEEILRMIADDYKKSINNISNSKIDEIKEENILGNIFIKVVNYKKNKDILKNCPHIVFHDLAISFRYLVKMDKAGIASAQLRNEEMSRLNMTVEELYPIAKENTKRLFPPVLTRLDELLEEKYDENIGCLGDNNLYILTNNQGINGASYIIYEDIINNFATEHDTDFFILPSSIHEILLLPVEDSMDKEELVEMVKEVNNYVVSELDYLSDNVYFYDRKIGKIIE